MSRKIIPTRLHSETWRGTLAYAEALSSRGEWSAFETWVNGSGFVRRTIIRALDKRAKGR
jgi:hypothetical protein